MVVKGYTQEWIEDWIGDEKYKLEYIRPKKKFSCVCKTEISNSKLILIQKKKRKQSPIGILISRKVGNECRVGWSLCHKKDRPFNLEIAIDIAINRTIYLRLNDPLRNVPQSIRKQFNEFKIKSEKYFQVGDYALQ